MRVLFAILVAAVLVVVAVSGLGAAGEADVLFVSSGSAEVGDETTVTLGVAEIADPPNSAWTIDITYDRTIVSAVSCEALSGSVCSPAFADDTFRSIGAIAAGIEAPMDFAHLTFLCEQSGESPLSISVSVWSDATMPIGREKVEIEEGTITCTEPADLITISSLDLEVGQQGTVVVAAELIAKPGLGAWQFDINYDAEIVSVVACDSGQIGVCNPVFDDDTVRLAGTSASGLTGTSEFGAIKFVCDREGESALTVRLSVWGNALGSVRNVEIEEGSITCTEPFDLITISSRDLEVGEEGMVRVEAERVAQPGVGAWTLDISYDSSVVSFLGCVGGDANVGASDVPTCGDESPSSVRVFGVSAEGLQPGTVLAEVEFRCGQSGETGLTGDIEVWSVATIAVPGLERNVEIQDGTIRCRSGLAAELPNTGSAEAWPGSLPAPVPLAVLGTVLLVAAVAFRRYASLR